MRYFLVIRMKYCVTLTYALYYSRQKSRHIDLLLLIKEYCYL